MARRVLVVVTLGWGGCPIAVRRRGLAWVHRFWRPGCRAVAAAGGRFRCGGAGERTGARERAGERNGDAVGIVSGHVDWTVYRADGARGWAGHLRQRFRDWG